MTTLSSSTAFCPFGFVGSNNYAKVFEIPRGKKCAVKKAQRLAQIASAAEHRKAAICGYTYLHLFANELAKIGLAYEIVHRSRRYTCIKIVLMEKSWH